MRKEWRGKSGKGGERERERQSERAMTYIELHETASGSRGK